MFYTYRWYMYDVAIYSVYEPGDYGPFIVSHSFESTQSVVVCLVKLFWRRMPHFLPYSFEGKKWRQILQDPDFFFVSNDSDNDIFWGKKIN